MNPYANVVLLENKLAETLADNHLVHTFRTRSYPVVLTISQDVSPEAQIAIFEDTEGSVSSRDAKLRLIFELDGLKIQTDSRLVLTEALMNKLKGLAKKLNSAYKEAFFADRIGVIESATPAKDTEGGTGEVEAKNDEAAGFSEFFDEDEEGGELSDDGAED